jgi:hypothetical protein
VSKFKRSLALEDVKETEMELEVYDPVRHLSISNVDADIQPLNQVVKVSGSITVSF